MFFLIKTQSTFIESISLSLSGTCAETSLFVQCIFFCVLEWFDGVPNDR